MATKTNKLTDKKRIAKLKTELAITQDTLTITRGQLEGARIEISMLRREAEEAQKKIENTEKLLEFRTWTGESLENELAASKKEISQIHDLLDILSDGGNGEREKYSPQTRLCAVLFSMHNGRA